MVHSPPTDSAERSLVEKIRRRLVADDPGPGTDWVGYSGGCDSHALLHLVASCRPTDRPLCALHVDHQLHPESSLWAVHCRQVCAALGVPLDVIRVAAHPRKGQSPEEAARTQRYRALSSRLGDGDRLLLAHHANDQAETFLLQLLRGAGLAGLAAMGWRSRCGAGVLMRPLRDVPSEEIVRYARRHHLSWIEDPSNGDRDVPRNFLRLEVMPLLAARWRGSLRTLARSADHCAESLDLLDDLARFDLGGADTSERLEIDRLLSSTAARQRNALRYWIRAAGYRVPPTAMLESVRVQCLLGRIDSQPRIVWGNCEVRRHRGLAYLLSRCAEQPVFTPRPWQGEPVLEFAGRRRLVATACEGAGIAPTRFIGDGQWIRFRCGGESIRLPRRPNKPLKKLFQEWGIPPWERFNIPLLYDADRLVGVIGYGYDESIVARPHEQGLVLDWQGY